LLCSNYGNLFSQGKGFEYESVIDNIPIDDLSIDRQNRIIILDHSNNLIRIFDSNRTFKKDIKLLEEQSDLYQPKFSSRKLAVDANSNIYCLTLSVEYFGSLIKFDSSGRFLKRFSSNEKMPHRSERIIDFYISNSNNIYLSTFPHGQTQAGDTPVYVYDSEGNFLEKVGYHIDDSEGNVYRFDKSQKDVAYFTKFTKHTSVRSKSSKDLSKLADIRLPEKHGMLTEKYGNIWTFAGFDDSNNLYLTNGVVTKKYNSHLKLIKEYNTSLYELEKQNIFCDQRNMKISPNGSIYIFGSKRTPSLSGTVTENRKETFVLIKVKHNDK